MAMIDPLYSLSGFAVGMLVGMTGVGGGALMTPILILLFGIHPATAVGTDLLYAAATKTGGSLVHGYARSIDWRVVQTAGERQRSGHGRHAGGAVALQSQRRRRARPDHAGAQRRAVRDRVRAGVRRPDRGALPRARERTRSQADGHYHGAGRRAARRAGLDLLGRRRRHRRGHAGAALSANADSQDHRLRYRARGAAHADRRSRPLDDGLGRLAHHRLAAGRLAAGHFRRQLFRHPHPGARLAAGAGDDAVRRGEPHRLRSRHRGLGDLHRLHAARRPLKPRRAAY